MSGEERGSLVVGDAYELVQLADAGVLTIFVEEHSADGGTQKKHAVEEVHVDGLGALRRTGRENEPKTDGVLWHDGWRKRTALAT